MSEVEGPGIRVSRGVVALRRCRFARCTAAGSAVIDTVGELLLAEEVVFEENSLSRAVSTYTREGHKRIFAYPEIPVCDPMACMYHVACTSRLDCHFK